MSAWHMAALNSGPLVIGHSWVSRLRESELLSHNFNFIDKRGGTFIKLAKELESVPVGQTHIDYIFVMLGGNDLHDAWDMSEVNEVQSMCNDFVLMLRARFPAAKLIIAQLEDRFDPGTWELDEGFKRKGNKFNKWLNKFSNKEALFTLKGRNYFSLPVWRSLDGVHLNEAGMIKLAAQIQDYYDQRKAG